MFCQECGSKNSTEAKFCGNCGAKAVREEDIAQPISVTKSAEADVGDVKCNADYIEGVNSTIPTPDKSRLTDTHFSANAELFSLDEIKEISDYDNTDSSRASTLSDAAVGAASFQHQDAAPSRKPYFIGVALALGFVACILCWTYIWTPYAEEKEIIEFAQLQDARLEREAVQKTEQEKIARQEEEKRMVLVAFQAAKDSGRITNLGEFSKQYPDSKFAKDAEELAYASLKRQNTSLALSAFQKWFPDRDVAISSENNDLDLVFGTWSGPRNSAGDPHGEGSGRFPDGSTFKGTYRNGKPSYGTEVNVDGSIYTGGFEDYQYSGEGKLTSSGGIVYTGEFLLGTFNGTGKFVMSKDTYYEGDFVNGEFNGTGKLFMPEGAYYEGEFINGNYHGKGKLVDVSGGSYEGDWYENNQTGQGLLKYPDGSSYIGYFIDGKQTGQGVYDGGDGTKYEGSFLNDEFHGRGTLLFADGTSIVAEFKNGELVE